MRRPSRARRNLKWTGAGLSLLVIAGWISSLWISANLVLPGNRSCVRLSSGKVMVLFANKDLVLLIGASTAIESQTWQGPQFERPRIEKYQYVNGGILTVVIIPHWVLVLLLIPATAWLWHRDRRRIPPGCCPWCGYNLTGNTSGVCSECGEKTATTPRRSARTQ